MEVMVAVQSGTLLHALRVQLKRRVSARRGGDYNLAPRSLCETIAINDQRAVPEPGATAVTDWLGIAFSTDWLSTDDLGQGVGERAQE